MKQSEQFEQLKKLRATDEQQARIYEKITTRSKKKIPTWQPFVALCSIIAILFFLVVVDTKEVVTSEQKHIQQVVIIPQEKQQLLFPAELYTNTQVITNDVVLDKLERVIAGEGAIEAAPPIDPTPWIGKSTSYIYVEAENETYLFLHEYLALYDTVQNKRYALTNTQEEMLWNTYTETPEYYMIFIIIFLLWQFGVETYYKLRKRKQKTILDAPKQWKGVAFILLGCIAGVMMVIVFSEAMVFKGYIILLLAINCAVQLYMRRFITEDRLDDITYTVSTVLQMILLAFILWQV